MVRFPVRGREFGQPAVHRRARRADERSVARPGRMVSERTLVRREPGSGRRRGIGDQPARCRSLAAGGTDRRAAARRLPAVSASHGAGSPDFREETIYFLITTRFYDGDPSNNFFCRDRIKFNSAGQPEDPHWRGDFRGLIQRLDYIRDLGFTAIWITPPVENRSGLDYHGYHPYDWTRIDARLESSGRGLPGPDRRGARAGDQDHPGRGDQPLLPVRHPRAGPYRPPADQVLRATGQAAGAGKLWPLSGQPRQLRLAEPRRHRQPGRPRLVSGATHARPPGHRAAGRSQDRRDRAEARL